MTPIQRWTSVLLAVAVLSGGGPAWAQATFSVSSMPSTVIRTGHAEPVGLLSVLDPVRNRRSPSVIPIDLSPAVLTSDTAVISTSGVPATGFSATVDPDCRASPVACPCRCGDRGRWWI